MNLAERDRYPERMMPFVTFAGDQTSNPLEYRLPWFVVRRCHSTTAIPMITFGRSRNNLTNTTYLQHISLLVALLASIIITVSITFLIISIYYYYYYNQVFYYHHYLYCLSYSLSHETERQRDWTREIHQIFQEFAV